MRHWAEMGSMFVLANAYSILFCKYIEYMLSVILFQTMFKACVRYFSPYDSPSKTMKNAF